METVFLLSLWLTSIPHTFIGFTRSDLRKPKLIALSMILFSALFAALWVASKQIDIALLFMAYFFWQQYHYARQNYGIFRLKNPQLPKSRLDSPFYVSIPLIAIVGALSDGPRFFFGYALKNPLPIGIPSPWPELMCGLTLLLYLAIRKPSQPWRPILHTALNVVCLMKFENFMLGWLALNLLHNVQYLKLMYDVEKTLRAFIIPVVLTLAFFGVQYLYPKSEPVWVLYLALNFTHYLWDSRIWKNSTINVQPNV